MTEAWIIDACRTPRGIGKVGKGALAGAAPAGARRHRAAGAGRAQRARHRRRGRHRLGHVHAGRHPGRRPRPHGRARCRLRHHRQRRHPGPLLRIGHLVGQLRRRVGHVRHGGRRHRRRHRDDVVVRRQRVEVALALPRQRQRPPARHPSPDEPGRRRRRHRHAGEDRPTGRRRAGGRVAAPGRDRHQGGPLRQVDSCRCTTSTAPSLLDREEYPRPGTTVDSLASLPSSFEALADIPLDENGTTYRSLVLQKFPGLEITHVHHAGNSSGVVDGAAALLMTSPEYATAHGLQPRARIVATANMGDDPTLMLNAPVPATRKVLAKAGMSLSDIDLFEVNEAFAVVPGEVHPRPRHRPREDQRQRRRHRAGPPHRRDRLAAGRHGAGRARAPGQAGRAHHHVRRRRHGTGGDHRAGLATSRIGSVTPTDVSEWVSAP